MKSKVSCQILTFSALIAYMGVEIAGIFETDLPRLLLPIIRWIMIYVWFRCYATNGTYTLFTDCKSSCDTKDAAISPCVKSKTWRLTPEVELPSSQTTMNLIKSRRSVFCRDLDPRIPLSEDYIKEILEAANWAPSHGNTKPWHFVVFREESSISALAEISFAAIKRQKGLEVFSKFKNEFDPNVRWRRAKALIAIIMRPQNLDSRRNPVWEEIAACSCAVQNMHLYLTTLPQVCGYWSSW